MSAQCKYRIGIWNANGLNQHLQELKVFLLNQNIDIMLVSESHITDKHHIKIHKYKTYYTKHPKEGKAHGGTALIIRENIKHHEAGKYEKENIQATSIVLEDNSGDLTVSAIYCPPKHNSKKQDYVDFFNTLGNRFIVGGDYNAKHHQWGSRLITTKGRELLKAIHTNNLEIISTCEPTYWPTDTEKTPDIIDFCITKGIDIKKTKTESCLDLSSDHTPIIVNILTQVKNKEKRPSLFSNRTDWNAFREELDKMIELQIPLKTENELEYAANALIVNIQQAAWRSTPDAYISEIKESVPSIIKQKVAEKRKLKKRWQVTRYPTDKSNLNRATRELKETMAEMENQKFQNYLENLTATQATDYSLWKATRNMKRPQLSIPPIKDDNNKWARSDSEKANLFAKHLSSIFQPHPSEIPNDEEDKIKEYLEAPFQMDLPIKNFKTKEIKRVITREINPRKAPGFDLITGRVLQESTKKCFKAITQIFNAIIRLNHFPNQWKVAQIVMILKPGKKSDDVKSYRPISLLPILSKVFEKLLLERLKPIIEQRGLIPNHQFGFRNRHGTIEQVHRIVKEINRDLENKRLCSAAFLDISQAFDKVWHDGLFYKLKKNLPHHFYSLLRSYLSNRHFLVKHQNDYTELHTINAGVPQGSVLGPVLYLLYTHDLPTTRLTTTATFADDTAFLASHIDPSSASRNLQICLTKVQYWLKKWRIKVNETKSVHVTFTLKRDTCPPVKLNNCQLPQSEEAKYLGIHLDRRLTWRNHIFAKRKQLGLKLRQMYWIIGRKSKLSIESKILLYKTILKPIWTYGIQLWGSAANSNLEILQRFQNKVLRMIVDAPSFVPNSVIHHDIPLPTIQVEIEKYSMKYRQRLSDHPNPLATTLFTNNEIEMRRLKRYTPEDLTHRFRTK